MSGVGQDRRRHHVKEGRSASNFRRFPGRFAGNRGARPPPISASLSNSTFDMITPQMMEKAVGQEITIVRVIPPPEREPAAKRRCLPQLAASCPEDRPAHRSAATTTRLRCVRVIFSRYPTTSSAGLPVGEHNRRARRNAAATLSYITPDSAGRRTMSPLHESGRQKIDVQFWVTLHEVSGTTRQGAQTLLASRVRFEVRWTARPTNTAVPSADRLHGAGTESGNRGDWAIIPVPARRTDHHREMCPDQAGQLPEVHAPLPAEHGYARNSATARLRKRRDAVSAQSSTASRRASDRRNRRSMTGRRFAFLHARQTRPFYPPVYRRKPHRSHADGSTLSTDYRGWPLSSKGMRSAKKILDIAILRWPKPICATRLTNAGAQCRR